MFKRNMQYWVPVGNGKNLLRKGDLIQELSIETTSDTPSGLREAAKNFQGGMEIAHCTSFHKIMCPPPKIRTF